MKSLGLLSGTRGHTHPTDVIEGIYFFFPSKNQNNHRSDSELGNRTERLFLSLKFLCIASIFKTHVLERSVLNTCHSI